MKDLIDAVWKSIEKMPCYDWNKMDGNIILSSLVGTILVLFACRITRAKSYDGRRPVEIRKKMMHSLCQTHHALFDIFVNESRDHIFCPSQGWDPPFSPDAQDGEYV